MSLNSRKGIRSAAYKKPPDKLDEVTITRETGEGLEEPVCLSRQILLNSKPERNAVSSPRINTGVFTTLIL